MKHPLFTLIVLTIVLIPWLAVVAFGDWLREKHGSPHGALSGKP